MLGAIFSKCFATATSSTRSKSTTPVAAHDEEHREARRQWTKMSASLMSSALFLTMVRISYVAKGPVSHFLNWALKQRSLQVAQRKQSQESHEAHLKETMLSTLVTSKAHAIMQEFSALLAEASMDDPERWGKIWILLVEHPQKIRDAKILIVSLVCTMACNWQMRFIDAVSAFPLRFLWCLEAKTQIHYDNTLRFTPLSKSMQWILNELYFLTPLFVSSL